MTDIEVKRKELETAKRIRDNGYECTGKILVRCLKDEYCPCSTGGGGGCRHWGKTDWDAFISAREAELAEIEKTTTKACEKCGGAGFYYTKGATTMEAVKRVCECQDQPSAPTLDDFALALIHGGFRFEPCELYDLAVEYKAESDRRRGV